MDTYSYHSILSCDIYRVIVSTSSNASTITQILIPKSGNNNNIYKYIHFIICNINAIKYVIRNVYVIYFFEICLYFSIFHT